MVSEIGCLLTSCVDLDDFGKSNFITFGFPKVDIIRKNNSRKNMMSFNDAVDTSASNLLCLFNFIITNQISEKLSCWLVQRIQEVHYGSLQMNTKFINHHIDTMITGIGNNPNHKTSKRRNHFFVQTIGNDFDGKVSGSGNIIENT